MSERLTDQQRERIATLADELESIKRYASHMADQESMQRTADDLRVALAVIAKHEAVAENADSLLERWDQTDSEMQRKIFLSFAEKVAELEAENERLKTRLLSAAGDDLCRLTQEEIKAMSAGAVQIPPKEEFLASCERFHAQVAGEAGVMSNCLTLAQLVAENEKLRGLLSESTSLWPVEKPEQGPLPGWVQNIKERVREALAQGTTP